MEILQSLLANNALANEVAQTFSRNDTHHPISMFELADDLRKLRYADTPVYAITAPTNDPQEREIFGLAMREMVYEKIQASRSDDPIKAYQAAQLLDLALSETSSFANWYGFLERILGRDQCQIIGMTVVMEQSLTLQETKRILSQHKKAHEAYKKEIGFIKR